MRRNKHFSISFLVNLLYLTLGAFIHNLPIISWSQSEDLLASRKGSLDDVSPDADVKELELLDRIELLPNGEFLSDSAGLGGADDGRTRLSWPQQNSFPLNRTASNNSQRYVVHWNIVLNIKCNIDVEWNRMTELFFSLFTTVLLLWSVRHNYTDSCLLIRCCAHPETQEARKISDGKHIVILLRNQSRRYKY